MQRRHRQSRAEAVPNINRLTAARGTIHVIALKWFETIRRSDPRIHGTTSSKATETGAP